MFQVQTREGQLSLENKCETLTRIRRDLVELLGNADVWNLNRAVIAHCGEYICEELEEALLEIDEKR